MEVAAPTLVLLAAVIEVICIAEERPRAGNSDVSVHIQVHTENHSVLGFFVPRGFDFFLHGDVEVVRAITLVERCFGFLPFIRPVVLERCPLVINWRDVLCGHAIIGSGEGYVVVVVRDGATVVDDDASSELGLACLFTVLDDSVFAVPECSSREVTSTLDEAGLQGEFVTNVGIRLVVERVLPVRDFVGVVVPSVVCDVSGRVSELLERLIEDFVVVLGNVEFDMDVPNDLRTSLV